MRNRLNLCYIDKTKYLEEGISRFPSIYIEGNAACGKTTAVEMFLQNHPEVETQIFDLKYEQKDYDAFIEKIEDLQKRAASESLWIVLENIPEKVRADVAAAMAELAEVINKESCVIFISREKPQMEFLELLWKQKMTLVNMEKLLLTEEEIRILTERMGVPFDAKQVLEKTGGWAGCVSLLIQLSKGGQGIDELLDSYEMSAYVKNEMLSGLEEEEFAFLQRAVGCPWVSKKMAEEVWGLTDTEKIMENLWRKGILLHDWERGFWKITPLFLRYVAVKMSELEKITAWYEREGYIAEALNCRERFGTEEAYRTFVLKYFDQVPLLGFLGEKVLKWKEKTPELCYLRGAYAYSVQDFEGLVREILTLKKNKENDHKSKEILLNLEYLNPERSLAEWLGLLEDLRGPGEKFRLYQMLGNSVTYLCGIRDISGLFACSKKEERQKARLWKESFEETGWKCYQLARIDYYLETEQKDSIPEDDLDLLSEKTDVKELWQLRMAKFYLLCKLQRMGSEDFRVERIYTLENSLLRENDPICVGIAESISALYAPWYGAKEKMSKWLRYTAVDNIMAVTEKNYVTLYCRVQGYLNLNQYERAEKLLKKLVPYLQAYHRYRFLAETFFQYALVNWEKDLKGQAMKNAIESFVIGGTRRYVTFYAGYGSKGQEILTSYVDWQKSNALEGWNRKKKYNYGNVLRMPMEEYWEYILRVAKKASKGNRKVSEEYIEERLTMMENIILQNLAKGLSNAQICEELHLKLPTVKGHVYNLFKKLGVNSRIQAVVKGKELGIIE